MSTKWILGTALLIAIAGVCNSLNAHTHPCEEGNDSSRGPASTLDNRRVAQGRQSDQKPAVATAPDRETAAERELRRYVSLCRKVGTYDLAENLYQVVPQDEEAIDKIVGLTRKKIAESRKRASRAAQVAFEETAKSFKANAKAKLEELRDASENAGYLSEQLRLFEHTQVQRLLKTTREDLERIVTAADEEVELMSEELVGKKARARRVSGSAEGKRSNGKIGKPNAAEESRKKHGRCLRK